MHPRVIRGPALAALLLLCSLRSTLATETTASVTIGGPSSYGGAGSFDPGTLDDGVTEASAIYAFTWNDATHTLTLEVQNTSPVSPSVENPILTEIYFNVPAIVSGMILQSQTSPDGQPAPHFDFHFEPDLLGKNPGDEEPSDATTATPFGTFSASLKAALGIAGGVRNPDAGTVPAGAGSAIAGPVTFEFSLSGALDDLAAYFFERTFSLIEPGERPSNGAARFEGGGESAAGGVVSDGSTDCNPLYLALGTPALCDEFCLVFNARLGCDGCVLLSVTPGPTVIPGLITLDVGLDFLLVFHLTFTSQSLLSVPVAVPANPNILGVTFYSQLVVLNPNPSGDPSLETSNLLVRTVRESRCDDGCPITIDFETEDDLLTPLANGQDISTPPEFGVLLAVSSSGRNEGAATFDSTIGGPNDPGRDPDLLVGLGNVLILQENSTQTTPGIFDFPDDDAQGGSFQFDFVTPVEMASIDLVDIDPGRGQHATVTLIDGAGKEREYDVPAGWTSDIASSGPPGYGTLDLTTLSPQAGFLSTATATEDPGFDPRDVVRLAVTLGSSGAVDNLRFCPSAR